MAARGRRHEWRRAGVKPMPRSRALASASDAVAVSIARTSKALMRFGGPGGSGLSRKAIMEQIDASLPGTQLTDQLLSLLEDEGHGEWTTAALYEVLLRMGAD